MTDAGRIRSVGALLSLAVAATLVAALSLPSFASAQKRPFYGVNTQGPLAGSDYDLMRDGGVGTLRFLISWRTVETERGKPYSVAGPDQIIGSAAARGVRTLPFVHGLPPDWVRNPPTRPVDRRSFRRLMKALAARYGRGGDYWRGPYQRQHGSDATPQPVRAWQLFNEQNGRFFWCGKPARPGCGASPRAYGQLIKMGARGVRSENPRAEIVLGGMFLDPAGGKQSLRSWRFLNRLYRVPRIRRFFDTVAVHPYAPNLRGIRTQMRRIRQVMRRNNDRMGRMRVTEYGWGSQPIGHPLTKTPRAQARLLRKSFRMFARKRQRRAWNLRGVNWYSWQDGGAGCPYCDSSGLFSGPPDNRTAKPSWTAFRRVAR
jgi:hypothetical protein